MHPVRREQVRALGLVALAAAGGGLAMAGGPWCIPAAWILIAAICGCGCIGGAYGDGCRHGMTRVWAMLRALTEEDA